MPSEKSLPSMSPFYYLSVNPPPDDFMRYLYVFNQQITQRRKCRQQKHSDLHWKYTMSEKY